MSSSATLTSPVRQARQAKMDRLAGRLAAFGAAPGVLAGAVDVAVGSSIRGWIANKLDPTPLGLVTVSPAVGRAQHPIGREPHPRDGLEFLELAPRGPWLTNVTSYPLEHANQALADLRAGRFSGAAVLVP